MTIDLSKVQAGSNFPGLQDLGSPTDIVSIQSGISIPIGGTVSRSIAIPFAVTNTMSVIRVKIDGHNVGGKWFPVIGNLIIQEGTISGGSISSAYVMYLTVQGSSTGRTLVIQFKNETVGSVVTVPTLTFTVHAHLYSYPW